jgi:TonB-dependent starch-binding outer membrane protein SusC
MKKNLLFILSLMLFSTTLWAQQTISGKVTGENGEILPGVNVRVKDTQAGSVTDGNGSYSIKTPAKGILVFSSVGFKNQEISIGSRNVINVSMTSDIGSLEEVVVIGYGTQKKASLTGAVASVTSKELTALPVPSIESALQGRVSGVQVTNNGSPGEAPIVRVRGIGSINYAANPLYVVDGYAVGSLNDIDTVISNH